jgi:hypothetical protein
LIDSGKVADRQVEAADDLISSHSAGELAEDVGFPRVGLALFSVKLLLVSAKSLPGVRGGRVATTPSSAKGA